MADIEFFLRTTVDFELFEKFGNFIVARHFKEYNADVLHDKLSDILKLTSGGRLRNMMSWARRNTFVFKLSEESYKAFCQEFIRVFKEKLTPEGQDEYKEIESAFYQWKSRLDDRYHITHEDIVHKINEINVENNEEMIPVVNYPGEQEPLSFASITEETLTNAINTISQYYGPNYSDELRYEVMALDMFKEVINLRVKEASDVSNNIFESRIVFKSRFKRNSWRIYELLEERVICRSVQFSKLPDYDHEQFLGFESYITLGRSNALDTLDQSSFKNHEVHARYMSDKLEYNCLHKMIIVENTNFERNNKSLDYNITEKYNFQYHDGDQEIFVGHKCSLNSKDVMTCVPAFLVRQPSNIVAPYYLEYDINSTDIPAAIRSRLIGYRYLDLNPFLNMFLTVAMTLG